MNDDDIIDMYLGNIEINEEEIINDRHIKYITYDYFGDKVIDEDYYRYLLESTIIVGHQYVFPEIKIMSLPIELNHYHDWCLILPNVSKFNSKAKFMINVVEARNEKLRKEIAGNDEFVREIQEQFVLDLQDHDEPIPLI